ncbi:MAG: Gfo/Idh/MocA family oxidoreductase [Opitutales bacterium]|nr:Gfo/Idh/MocA family oxidoreductase [Opitutales bacterium]
MPTQKNKPIRWGLLAAGGIARKFVAGARALPDAQVCAVASRTPGKAETFARELAVSKSYDSYEALVEDPDIDAVYVAGTHNLHEGATLLALEAGKPVLCEKPLAVNAAEVQRMRAKAEEKKLFLMEAMWTRFLPAIVQLREWIAEGRIGTVRQVIASFGVPATPESCPRLFDPALAGGTLLDRGIYPLSFASMIAGGQNPEAINSLGTLGPTGVDHEVLIQARYPGDILASLETSLSFRSDNTATVVGTKGKIHLPDLFFCAQEVTLETKGEKVVRSFPEPWEEMFRHQIAEVHRCLRAGEWESPTMPLAESERLAEQMDDMRASWGLRYPGEE